MALDPDQLQKPFRKLRKTLKKLPKEPTPEEVHDLRTWSRRIEATLHALLLDRKAQGRRVLKAITPVRKRAGQVRDMDVLTAFASTLASDSHKDCLVQLLEHLGQERHRGARKLYAKASNKRRKAACSLKRCFRSIGRNLNGGRGQRDWPADTASDAMRLSSELAKWPNLNRENLHPFRLKVKELRNVLRLSGDDDKFVELLGDVKDRIGEWHDWTELSAIADEVIQHKGRCAIRDQISAGAQARFSHALRIAQQLRDEYFGSTDKGSRRRANSAAMNDSVLKASAKLAT